MNGGSAGSLRRGFLSVVPPPDVLAALDEALVPVRTVAPPRLSWSRPSQWHLTAQFLGPVADVDALVRAVGRTVAGESVFAVGLGGVGAFPSPDRASVVWVGLDEGVDALASLAGAVERATAPLGYQSEGRPYAAHLTVARARRPCPVGSVLASIGDGPFGRTWDVREIVLFESDTRPTGAVYREVAHVPFGAGQPNR
ncbi:MAG: RNA 2',3'-cyclic phosphodiesterase [Acidimicrobiia bacterium]